MKGALARTLLAASLLAAGASHARGCTPPPHAATTL